MALSDEELVESGNRVGDVDIDVIIHIPSPENRPAATGAAGFNVPA